MGRLVFVHHPPEEVVERYKILLAKDLVYTGFRGDLEHLTIETRLIVESFEYVMGECDY